MPIYEYRCSDCGFQDEFLQKVSEPRLTTCPSCGKATFTKLLSAVGFQLKGSGWYATDFKGSGGKAAKPAGDGKSEPQTGAATEAKADAKSDAAGNKTAGEKTAASSSTTPAAG